MDTGFSGDWIKPHACACNADENGYFPEKLANFAKWVSVSLAIYNVYGCEEGDGRYKAVVGAHLNGRYVRRYFPTKTDAKTWAEMKNIEAQNRGTEHAEFPTAPPMQAQTAAQLLELHGVSLLEAVKIALPILETRGKSLPVKDAVSKFLEDYRLHGGPKAAVPSVSYLAYLEDMPLRSP